MSNSLQRGHDHGSASKRGHVQAGRIHRVESSAESERLRSGEKRGRIRTHAAAESEHHAAEALVGRRLVLVEWVDSYGCSATWQPLTGSTPTALICRSVGWLVHDGADCKVVVPHISDENNEHATSQGCGDMTIPSRAVLKIANLTVTSARPRSRCAQCTRS
jgi:hypothetical protein